LTRSNVSTEAMGARFALLESMSNIPPTTTKRAVRTTTKKEAAPKAVGAKKKVGGKTDGKANNAMHFFKRLIVENIDNAQDTYLTEENLEAIKDNKDVVGRSRDIDEGKFLAGCSSAIWSTVLSIEQKKVVRSLLDADNEKNDRNDAKPQLEEDAEAE